MKILINHLLEPGNRISGISKYLFSLLTELLQRNEHDYVLLTSWDAAKLPATLHHPRLQVVSLPYIESTPRNILRQLWLLPRYMKQFRAELEFNCNPVGNFLGRWPKVTVTHDLYFDVSPSSYKPHHRLWWRWFFPLSCRSASRIICVSENTRRDLQKFHPQFADKTVVITEGPCLPVPETVSSDPALRQPFGLFVANVSPNKGADTLLKALQYSQQQGTHIAIKHVGSDSLGYFRNGGEAAPVATGYLSDEQLGELYAQARFLAFPSRYEGFGLPVIEAQAYGTPVLASDIPVLREVAGQGALFSEPEDPQALAVNMQKLLTDDLLFSQLSQQAWHNQQRFTWQDAAAKTAMLFTELLSGQPDSARARYAYRRDES